MRKNIMDSETEDLVYCDLCGYLKLDDLCEHITVEIKGNDSMIVGAVDSAGESTQGETFEELLISLIECRPPLWNIRLPISERSKGVRDNLWLEIYNALNCQYKIEVLQKKWRNLRDQYIKKKSEFEEYTPSGSATNAKKKKPWKHYYQLKFLSDTVAPRKTTTSLDKIESISTASSSSSTVISSKKKTSSSSRVEEALIDAINNVQPPKQMPKEIPYEINPICLRISRVLDQMEEPKRAKLEIQLLSQTYSVAYPNLNM